MSPKPDWSAQVPQTTVWISSVLGSWESKARQQITIHIYGRAFSGQMNTTEKGQYQRCLPLGLGGGDEERPCQHRSGDRLYANCGGRE